MSETTKAVSYAEWHQAFHVYAYENALTANARALYSYIVGEFNAAYWRASELSKSVRDVKAECGFKSESTVQRAKAELATENIIKISKRKNSDVYQLVNPAEWKQAASLNKNSLEQNWNTSGTLLEQNGNTLESSYYACAKDNKDVEDDKTSSPPSPIRAREKISQNSEEVKQAWLENEGEHLKGGKALGLIELEKSYGAEKVVAAINEASRANTQPRLSYNFVKAVLERMQKGGEKRGKIIALNAESTVADDWEHRRPSWIDAQ